MHRKPKIKPPETTTSLGTPTDDAAVSASRVDAEEHGHRGILGIEATKTRKRRTLGRCPENLRGSIELENVELFYPARPQRRVLNGLNMKIEPGSVVALGTSYQKQAQCYATRPYGTCVLC